MAFNLEEFVKKQNTSIKSNSGFDVNAFLIKQGIQPKLDLTTTEGLAQQAEYSGLGDQAKKITDNTDKLSFLQRLGKGLGAFNPAEAILTGVEKNNIASGVLAYGKNVFQGLGSAITGKDYEPQRRYFSDVVEKLGITNTIAKFGLGFLGDVLLDPTTYFGGAIARGVAKGGATIGSRALTTLGKISPEAEAGLRLAGAGISDAFGRAFQYGFKSTVGAKEDVLTFLSKQQQAKLGLAASNLDRLGTGILTQAQREELAIKLIAGKRAEFVAREAGATLEEAGQAAREAALKGTSEDVSKVIEAQIQRSKKFAEGITENPYETYFPFIQKDKLAKFLNESRGIKVGSEGYRKQFKNLLTNDNLELDPAKAFFTRESQIVSDKMTREFLNDFIEKYGKPLDYFNSADEALRSGFSPIKEKGIFGKEIGYVSKYDAALLRDSITPEFQTINMLAKATGFDAITSLFKRSVTGLFAPFHIRNYLSGLVQNYEVLGLDSLNPKNIAIGQKVAYLLGKGEKLPPKLQKIWKPFIDRFSGDTFYNAEFDLALKNSSELKSAAKLFSRSRLKETAKTLGLGQEAIPFKVGRAVGQFIEHQQKAVAYITAIDQGKEIPAALKLAESAGFDYRALTRFESQIMRRLIPFYSFTRKNIELQLKTLSENPQRINQVIRFFQNNPLQLLGIKSGTPLTPEEKRVLPTFIKESLGIHLQDTPEGLKQFISSFGTPVEAFTSLFESNPILRVLSMTNPILKTPIEIGVGKDSFRQRDLKDVYSANEYEMAPQVIKDLLDIREVKKPVYQNKYGRQVKVGEKISYIADPVRLLIARSLFTSRGVSYLDQVFGNDLQGLIKVIKTTTGIKPQQVNIESQKYFNDIDKKRALEDLLNRYGVVKQYSVPYVPKK